MNLKLFVWEDVLSDYTDGIMFALAESKEEAIGIILEKAGSYPSLILRGDFYLMRSEIEGKEPKVYDEKVGFFVFGGA